MSDTAAAPAIAPGERALPAIRAAISAASIINEGSAWLMAARMLAHLDASGWKVVDARSPALRDSRSMSVSLATYQQILGERNALLAKVAALNGEIERYRDMVGEADTDDTTGD